MRHLVIALALFAAAGCAGAASPSATPAATSTAAVVASPSGRTTPAPSLVAGATPSWIALTSTGPAAREDHTWTADADGAFAYLFGGHAGAKVFDDLWRHDLAADAWTQLAPSGAGPKARFGHSAVWADGVGLVVWAGQAANGSFFNDLWAYDPAANSWRNLPANGAVPKPRYGSCAVAEAGRVWISHGFTDAGRFSDTRVYDIASGTWTDVTPTGEAPIKRCLHDCLWAPDGRLLLYGGQTDGVPALGDLWAFDTAARTWQQLPKPQAPPRQLYALGVSDTVAWLFGGAGADRQPLDDLWALDLNTFTWTPVSPSGSRPSARSGAAFVADHARGRLVLFGGLSSEGALADLWQLTLAR